MRPYEAAGWTQNLIRAGGMRPGERVLVVVDEPLAEEGLELATAVREAGGDPHLELWAGERPFAAPPPGVAAAAAQASFCIFLSREPRRDEAGARIALNDILRAHDGREIYCGLVDRDLLEQDLSKPPPDLVEPARRLLGELKGRDTIRIRGRAGTDLTFRIGDRDWQTDAGELEPGDFANYPGGEVFVSPLEDNADGVLVADLTVPYTVEGLVDEPVILRFAGGRVQSIEGGRAAEMLNDLIEEAGPSGRVIAELGIGLNPTVTPRGHVMLDEKAARTAHVAIGNNTGTLGGVNSSTIHVDCVFSDPEIEADGQPVELPVP